MLRKIGSQQEIKGNYVQDLPKKAILNDELLCLLAEYTLSRIDCVDVEGLHKGLRKNAGRTHEMSGETVFQPNG